MAKPAAECFRAERARSSGDDPLDFEEGAIRKVSILLLKKQGALTLVQIIPSFPQGLQFQKMR